MSLLEVQHINTGYGKKQVLFDVNLLVEEGETVLLIGSNGSGKSTLFKAMYGIVPIWNNQVQGKILFNGNEVTNKPSHCLINKGLMYIPQKNELFEDMTVEQNLEMALLHLNNKQESKKRIEEVFAQIDILQSKRKQIASKLSGGERKLLSLGMVLANRPKAVLYDEPLAGLSGNNVSVVLNWLKTIKENGTTLIVIEHRIKELLSLADNIIGLKLGRKNAKTLDNIENIKSFMV
ncbi:ATP-binding cassette domain-containing protein [Candidatus Nomurabacteria bacterium]|nr:ATP-binding cassette domain-containing protein [Bacteroidota bacterium]MCB9820908.1 ATP-binding cassette domain-containing protein [Candidatus Nomurabacteria bacterium]